MAFAAWLGEIRRRCSDARVSMIFNSTDLYWRHPMPFSDAAHECPQALFDILMDEFFSVLRAENKMQVYL